MPLASDHRSPQAVKAVPAEAEHQDNLAGRSIIVVEDDPAILLALEMLLGDWGMEVHSTYSGPGGSSPAGPIATPAGSVAVSDSACRTDAAGWMPSQSSINAGGGPAILMTGDTAPERLNEAKRSGYRLLHKPINPEDLRRTLVECL